MLLKFLKKIKEFIAQKNHVASFELTDMYKKSVLSISFAEAYRLGWKKFDQEDLFEFRRREELSQLYYSEKTEKNVLTLFFQKSLKTKKSQKRQENLAAVKKELLPFLK